VATEHGRGQVVVDTDVYSARLIPDSTLARRYESLLVGRAEFVSFQTVAEVRYGALLRRWGDTRLRRMEAAFSQIEIVYPGPDLIRAYAPYGTYLRSVLHVDMDARRGSVHPADHP
jgi:predicted nucleic acid-binding protein